MVVLEQLQPALFQRALCASRSDALSLGILLNLTTVHSEVLYQCLDVLAAGCTWCGVPVWRAISAGR